MRISIIGCLAPLAVLLISGCDARLRWKCELFDTSAENITKRTTFIDHLPDQNVRPTRSAVPKCRVRPRNEIEPREKGSGSITRKLALPSNVKPKKKPDFPVTMKRDSKVRYERKPKEGPNGLIVGPGYNSSDEKRGPSAPKKPMRGMPSKLLSANELSTPPSKRLDANMMPDFDLDDNDDEKDDKNLPWCDEVFDCEHDDFKKFDTEILDEFYRVCKEKLIPKKVDMIEKILKITSTRTTTPPTDSTRAMPPTSKKPYDCLNAKKGKMSAADKKLYEKYCSYQTLDIEITEKCVEMLDHNESSRRFTEKCCEPLASTIHKMNSNRKKKFDNICHPNTHTSVTKKVLIYKGKNCADVDYKSLSKKEKKAYRKDCQKGTDGDGMDVDTTTPPMEPNPEMVTPRTDKERISPMTHKADCLHRQKSTEKMSDAEYKKFLIECADVDVDLDGITSRRTPTTTPSSSVTKNMPGHSPDCSKQKDLEKMSDRERKKYLEKCPHVGKSVHKMSNNNEYCESVVYELMTTREFVEFRKMCLVTIVDPKNPIKKLLMRKTSHCLEAVKIEMDDSEYKKFIRMCIVKEPKPTATTIKLIKIKKEVDCEDQDYTTMTRKQYRKFEEKCLEEVVEDCDSVDVDSLTNAEYKLYQRHCLDEEEIEEIEDCNKVTDAMTIEEFEKYKKNCVHRTVVIEKKDCSTKDLRFMNQREYRAYERQCGKPRDFCKMRKAYYKDMNKAERKAFKRNCEKEYCEVVDVSKLSKIEKEEFIRNCDKKHIRTIEKTSICENVQIDELTQDEMVQYKRHCKPEKQIILVKSTKTYPNGTKVTERRVKVLNPDGKIENGCDENMRNKMSRKAYQKYMEECHSPKSVLDCDKIETKGLSAEEAERRIKLCKDDAKLTTKTLKPREKEIVEKKIEKSYCEKVDVSSLSVKEKKEYIKECVEKKKKQTIVLKNGEKKTCATVDVDELDGDELKWYNRECVPRTVSKNVTKVIGVKKTKKNHGFDCTNVNVDDLSAEELQRYQRECTHLIKKTVEKHTIEHPFDCEDVDVDSLSRKEYKRYLKECSTSDKKCSEVDVEDLNAEELDEYRRVCEGKERIIVVKSSKNRPDGTKIVIKEVKAITPRGKTKRIFVCGRTDLDSLSQQEYRRYMKKCISEKNVIDCDELHKKNELTRKQMKHYMDHCGITNKPRTKSKKKFTCERVDVANLKGEDAILYQKICQHVNGNEIVLVKTSATLPNGTQVTVKGVKIIPPTEKLFVIDGCDESKTKNMTNEEYGRYLKECTKKSIVVTCDNYEKLNLPEKDIQKFVMKCKQSYSVNQKIVNPRGKTLQKVDVMSPKKPFDCHTNVSELTEEQAIEYRKICEDSEGKKVVLVKKSKKHPNGTEYTEKSVKVVPPPEKPFVVNGCDARKKEDMSEEDYAKYIEECTKKTRIVTCGNYKEIDLSDEDREKFSEKCKKRMTIDQKIVSPKEKTLKNVDVKHPDKFDCHTDVNELTEEQAIEYRKICTNTEGKEVHLVKNVKKLPNGTEVVAKRVKIKPPKEKPFVVNGCDESKMKEMDKEEYEKYIEECTKRTTIVTCDNYESLKLPEEQILKFIAKCKKHLTVDKKIVSPREKTVEKVDVIHPSKGSDCDADVTELTTKEQYEKYLLECVNDSDSVDCDMIDPRGLSRKAMKVYRKKCAGTPINRGDKKIILVKTLIIHPNNVTEIRKQVKIINPGEPPRVIDCHDNPTGLDEFEYEQFELQCHGKKTVLKGGKVTVVKKVAPGKTVLTQSQVLVNNKFDCYNVNPEDLDEDQFELMKKQCINKTAKIGRKSYNCEVDISQLSDSEYAEYQRHCVRTRKCSSVDVDALTAAEYKDYLRECGEVHHPAHITTTPRTFTTKIIMIKDSCENVDINTMTKKEYVDYKNKCLKPGKRKSGAKVISIKKVVILKKGGCDLNTDSMTQKEYDDYIKKCGATEKTTLVKTVKINSPRIEKLKLLTKTSFPDEDTEEVEDQLGVKVITKVVKLKNRVRPDGDGDNEHGKIIVMKKVLKIPRRVRPTDGVDEVDEGGRIVVHKKLIKIMKEVPKDSDEVEEIETRPKKEVVILKVHKKPILKINPDTGEIIEDKGNEIIKVVKLRQTPEDRWKKVILRKVMKLNIPHKNYNDYYDEDQDLIVKKKVHRKIVRVRKLKSTTTTTTTPAPPEYYYDEIEVPTETIVVSVKSSKRRLPKEEELEPEVEEEIVDVRHEKPKSPRYQGYIKVEKKVVKVPIRKPKTYSGDDELEEDDVIRKIVKSKRKPKLRVLVTAKERKIHPKTKFIEEETDDQGDYGKTYVRVKNIGRQMIHQRKIIDESSGPDENLHVSVRAMKFRIQDDNDKDDSTDYEETENIGGAIRIKKLKNRNIGTTKILKVVKKTTTSPRDIFIRKHRNQQPEDSDKEIKRYYVKDKIGKKVLVRTEKNGKIIKDVLRKNATKPDDYDDDVKTRWVSKTKGSPIRKGSMFRIKKHYKILPNGQRVLVNKKRYGDDGSKNVEEEEEEGGREIIRTRRRYKILPNGQRVLIGTTRDRKNENDGLDDPHHGKTTVRRYEVLRNGKRVLIGDGGDRTNDDGIEMIRRKTKRVIRKDGGEDEEDDESGRKTTRVKKHDNDGDEEESEGMTIRVKKMKKHETIEDDEIQSGRTTMRLKKNRVGGDDETEEESGRITTRIKRIHKNGRKRGDLESDGDDEETGKITTRVRKINGRKSIDDQPADQERNHIKKIMRGTSAMKINHTTRETSEDGGEEEQHVIRTKKTYKILPNGQRVLVGTKTFNDTGSEGLMAGTRRHYKILPNGKRVLIGIEPLNGAKQFIKKRKQVVESEDEGKNAEDSGKNYRVMPDGRKVRWSTTGADDEKPDAEDGMKAFLRMKKGGGKKYVKRTKSQHHEEHHDDHEEKRVRMKNGERTEVREKEEHSDESSHMKRMIGQDGAGIQHYRLSLKKRVLGENGADIENEHASHNTRRFGEDDENGRRRAGSGRRDSVDEANVSHSKRMFGEDEAGIQRHHKRSVTGHKKMEKGGSREGSDSTDPGVVHATNGEEDEIRREATDDE
ncbi:unnamed protein product [Caenorhabditis bovis]|uniref:Uncharacterized protein n=1 Tax=Caenorhabditis bovis TaxID=2654633 RepID=A0A8S1F469_9PELO|nr:unnamed protein product [Caenorhabditis bovis]